LLETFLYLRPRYTVYLLHMESQGCSVPYILISSVLEPGQQGAKILDWIQSRTNNKVTAPAPGQKQEFHT
jgi:hypothetical protein